MNKSIILFDSTCKLCSNAVRIISKFDSRKRFCFLPLASEKAAEYLKLYRGNVSEKGTMMLISGENIFVKSDAVLRILRSLDGLWPVFYIFLIVPRFIRDPVYDIVSKYRYRWFGHCIDCPEYRSC